MQRPEDATALALAASAGDREALADLIRVTQTDVWRFIALLAGRDAADDLTQETYLRMLGALASFEGRSSVLTWLLTIARRVVVDRVRYERARPRTVPLNDDDMSSGVTSGWLSSRADAVELSLLVGALTPARREAFVLTQVWGMAYHEAADVMGCPVGTVRSRVARARADLLVALAAADAHASGLADAATGGRPA